MRAAILLFLTVLLISPPAVSLAQNDKLIVPGVRIGKWTLAMTIDNLLRMNGPASTEVLYAGGEESLDFRRDSSLYGWESVGVGANTFDKKTIVALVAGVRGAMVPYKTDRGFPTLGAVRQL